MGVPAAIVPCKVVTGRATVRALGQAGVDVHAVVLDTGDPVRLSRYATTVHFVDEKPDDDALLDFLVHYAQQLGNRPVVFPTSDAQALLLARHFDRLNRCCRISTTRHADLLDIVSKASLPQAHALAGPPGRYRVLCRETPEASDALTEWLGSVLGCRSFAYLSWRDPAPGIDRLGQIAGRVLSFALKRFIPR